MHAGTGSHERDVNTLSDAPSGTDGGIPAAESQGACRYVYYEFAYVPERHSSCPVGVNFYNLN